MITEAQRQERINYIGSSDAAAVLGLSRWNTPLGIWAEKTGQIVPPDISDKIQIRTGNKLEAVVSEMFEEDTGKKLHRKNDTIYHPKYSFIASNIDRRVVGERAGFEAKTASAFKAKEWEGEDIPLEYIIQCHHNLAVTGWDRWYLAVLIGNQDFQIKIIERDEKLLNDLVEKEVAFWNNFVVTKDMPMQIKANDGDVLYQLFPHGDESEAIELTDQANAIIESIDSLNADAKVIERQIDEQKNELKAMLKDSAVGKTGLYTVSWKNIQTKEYTVAAKEYRKLTIKKNKKLGVE